jgi:hypothetical protein
MHREGGMTDDAHWTRVLVFLAVVAVLGLGSWALGLVSYRLLLWMAFGRAHAYADWRTVAAWSGLVLLPLLEIVCLPVLAWLDDRVTGPRRVLTFGALGAVLTMAPLTAFGGLVGGLVPRTPPELILSLSLFGIAGAAFAAGFAVIVPRL